MICPKCQSEFKGRRFFRSGVRGAFRRCPFGHDFKEPPKSAKLTPTIWKVIRRGGYDEQLEIVEVSGTPLGVVVIVRNPLKEVAK